MTGIHWFKNENYYKVRGWLEKHGFTKTSNYGYFDAGKTRGWQEFDNGVETITLNCTIIVNGKGNLQCDKVYSYSNDIYDSVNNSYDNSCHINEGREIRNREFRRALNDVGLDRIHLYQDNGYLWIWSDDETEDFRDSSFFLNDFKDQTIEEWIKDIVDRVAMNESRITFKQYKALNESVNGEYKPIDEYDEFTLRAIEEYIEANMYEHSYLYKKPLWETQWYNTLSFNARQVEVDKMQKYKEKNNAARVANSTKDLYKLLWRMNWCRKNNWPDGEREFRRVAYGMLLNNDPVRQKQIELTAAKYKKEKEDFDIEVSNADTTKYAPKDRDWEKMIDYMNKKSDPQRLADSCKDANKVISRYIIAKCLGWDKAADAFGKRAIFYKYATSAELEAYVKKYIDSMPEKWSSYIEALKSDARSGLNKIVDKSNEGINIKIQKILDDAYNIQDYENVINDFVVKLITIDNEEYYLIYCLDKTLISTQYNSWKNRYDKFIVAGWVAIVDKLPDKIRTYSYRTLKSYIENSENDFKFHKINYFVKISDLKDVLQYMLEKI